MGKLQPSVTTEPKFSELKCIQKGEGLADVRPSPYQEPTISTNQGD
jgi:hypothetical protein